MQGKFVATGKKNFPSTFLTREELGFLLLSFALVLAIAFLFEE